MQRPENDDVLSRYDVQDPVIALDKLANLDVLSLGHDSLGTRKRGQLARAYRDAVDQTISEAG